MTVVVYGLYDPREKRRIRYVGMTARLKDRVIQHMKNRPRHWQFQARRDWIQRLTDEGRGLGVVIIATYSNRKDATEREWLEIRDRRRRGECDLNIRTPAPRSLHDAILAESPPDEDYIGRAARLIA